jgi:hypothetical protein
MSGHSHTSGKGNPRDHAFEPLGGNDTLPLSPLHTPPSSSVFYTGPTWASGRRWPPSACMSPCHAACWASTQAFRCTRCHPWDKLGHLPYQPSLLWHREGKEPSSHHFRPLVILFIAHNRPTWPPRRRPAQTCVTSVCGDEPPGDCDH